MSSSVYVVEQLQPDTLYKFYAVSYTAAGPSFENSSIVEATTASGGLTALHYSAIGIGVIFVFVFVAIGAFTCFK